MTDLSFLSKAKSNGVNFIPGKISSAQSAKSKVSERDFKFFNPEDLEDLTLGLDYLCKLYDYNVTLSVQPKYIGSRFNLYLFNTDLDESIKTSYGVTKNGSVIKPFSQSDGTDKLTQEEFSMIVRDILTRLKPWMDTNGVRMMIIDGVIQPKRVLESDLFDTKIIPTDAGLSVESELMSKYSFDEVVKSILNRFEGINTFYSELDEIDRLLVYGENLVHDYENFRDLYHLPNEHEMLKYSSTYHLQIQATNSSKICFKPFSILKICFVDGTESIPLLQEVYSQGEMFDILQKNNQMNAQHLQIKIKSASDLKIAQIRIRSFFKQLTIDNGFGGIVLKPAYITENTIPMMQIRNSDYLMMKYGYDYRIKNKLYALVMSKDVPSEITKSIQEFQLGMEMLVIPIHEIASSMEYDEIFLKLTEC